ncbi:uncharacterized protein I206_103866 [Kwoniella pini CBS 10737]|uniref:CCZ1/INTU/HSP4 first Longin domain-containing protein n=1 Tax=Kwoniella pini CBS 10737 TaxID=1296096 RepID=A0A1B9I3C9_9TREE|nr:uncharacterized protein I206_04563 [Kwoniella pini CBS 10737]OCF50032.1 hypothetical protein I206_04563 [Kwoniella pini CBS 10737]
MPPHTASPGPSKIIPASLSHFVIFNPTIKPDIPRTDNKDEDDDIKEAAQILFYTSREAGGVSRDKMLRQVGLAKGLMGFANMLVDSTDKYTSIHGNRSRMLIYTPESDFYIYVCINLSHLDNEKSDPITHSQGISDHNLIDGLARGYEDFRLLNGPLRSHQIPSAALSDTLDRYFTRFAFQFESTYLTSPSLSDWVGGYPRSSIPEDTFENYRSPVKGSLLIVGPDGPLYQDDEADPALVRYMHNLVKATIPPPALPSVPAKEDRQTLGFGLNLGIGRRTQTSRTGSWTTLGGWVPELRRVSTPSRSSTPPVVPKDETPKRSEEEAKSKWGFGLGGLSDAVGNVGTVFGLGKSTTTPIRSEDNVQKDSLIIIKNEQAPSESENLAVDTSPVPHHVEQSLIAVAELEDAVEPDEDIEWEGRNLWIKIGGKDDYEKRRSCWIIRNNILVAIAFPLHAPPPYNLPSAKATIKLFSKLSKIISVEDRPIHQNTCIALIGQDRISEGEFDTISDQSLIQLKSTLESPPFVTEILAKSTTSRFLVAKKTEQQSLYMKIGAEDASLTDADYAVRTFSRTHAPPSGV